MSGSGAPLNRAFPVTVPSQRQGSCTAPSPGARTGHALTYDPVAKRVVMFGGSVDDAADPLPQSLWAWDGQHWNCIAASGPPGRRDAFLAYDSQRKRLILFGGRVVGQSRTDIRFLRDTWEWDGNAWSLVDTAGPAPRIHGAAAYDAGRHAVVIQGGGGADSILTDTWEWNGARWRAIPLPMRASAIIDALFPAANGLMTLVGLRDSAPACTRLRRAVVFNIAGDTLAMSGAPGPCFSPQTPATVAAGGSLLLYSSWLPERPSETWIFSDGGWRQATSSPPRRRGAQAAYDEDRRRVVLFGGDNDQGLLGDTWEWDGERWQEINR